MSPFYRPQHSAGHPSLLSRLREWWHGWLDRILSDDDQAEDWYDSHAADSSWIAPPDWQPYYTCLGCDAPPDGAHLPACPMVPHGRTRREPSAFWLDSPREITALHWPSKSDLELAARYMTAPIWTGLVAA